MRLFFAVKLELSDRDLNQNGDGKNRKKKKKEYSRFSLFEDLVFADLPSD